MGRREMGFQPDFRWSLLQPETIRKEAWHSSRSLTSALSETGCVNTMIKFELRQNNKGFSLVELSVLLAMMAVLAAFAVPSLNDSMRSMQLGSDARSISTSMTYAKQSAMAQLTHYRLSFTPHSNAWFLEKLNKSSGAFERQQAVNTLSKGVANSGIAFKNTSDSGPAGFSTTSSTAVRFNSRGLSVDSSGNLTPAIVYLSNATQDFAISASLAGKIQLWKRQNGQWVAQ